MVSTVTRNASTRSVAGMKAQGHSITFSIRQPAPQYIKSRIYHHFQLTNQFFFQGLILSIKLQEMYHDILLGSHSTEIRIQVVH